MIAPVEGRITTDYFEPRPLSKPPDKRDHVHGAIDIAAPVSSVIRAPERGTVFAWCAYRLEPGKYWPEMPMVHGVPFQWCNYFYDTFGGCLFLRSYDGQRMHVMTHSYANQIFNSSIFQHVVSIEEKADERFPMHAFCTELVTVRKGYTIGSVGNAGYSTGPHVHWEIHRGHMWNRWDGRINPEREVV